MHCVIKNNGHDKITKLLLLQCDLFTIILFTIKGKKVKTSIYIARFMHQAPLMRTSLKLTRQTAIFRSPPSLQTQPGQ